KITTIFVFVGFATPDFWLALMLMILFGVQLGWLPISGLRSPTWEYLAFWAQQWDFVTHLTLPILVATFGGLAGFSRYMRQSMLEVVRQDYIQSARAKGLSEKVVIGKHALRNALLPIVTVLGLSLPGLIGGSVIVESIFAIPGMGQLMVQAVFERDYPVIMGNLVIVATLTLFANLIADLTYSLVDPRIRVAARRGRRSARERFLARVSSKPARADRRGRRRDPGAAGRAGAGDRAVGSEPPGRATDPRQALARPPARHRSARPRRALAHALRRPRLAGGRLRLRRDRDAHRHRARRGGRLPRRGGPPARGGRGRTPAR